MANHIDTSTIENFDGMTPEEQVQALLGVEIPEVVDMSAWVPKKTFDAKASEAAELGRKLKSKMSDDEKDAAEKEAAKLAAEQELAAVKAERDQLIKDKQIAEYKARYLALGYDEKLAEDTANALSDGDAERVFKNSQKHQEAYAKKIEKELMDGTPKPGGNGAGDKPMTKEEIFNIKDPVERQEAIAANMGLFGG